MSGGAMRKPVKKRKMNERRDLSMMQKDSSDIKNRAVIGKISGMVGIACNVLLAGSKIFVGSIAGSMSVIADGVNNLSDAGSSFVTLIGFRLAEKPADKEHPYGHARFEYLSSLTIAVMILVVGIELAKSSVSKVLHPQSVEYSVIMIAVLFFSVFVKLGMMIFNKKMGNKIQSATLIATAVDSRNDVITTCAVLMAIFVEYKTGYRIDGWMGMLVSVFILYSGWEIAKDAVSPLLGEGGNMELQRQITTYVEENPMVIGCHDLLIHDYGPGKRYASIHVEMDSNTDAMLCHEVIDEMERTVLQQYNTHLVIHYDPVVTDDARINDIRQKVTAILKEYAKELSLHDFRMIPGEDCIFVVFDLVLPERLLGEEKAIQDMLQERLCGEEKENYRMDITFDLDTGMM